jgi:YHS domain-containing protein
MEDPAQTADMSQDPNCGTYVPKKQSITKLVQGKEYFFCSKKCADEYSSKKE